MKTMKELSNGKQEAAEPMRAQLPQDVTADMKCWYPGQLPVGGFRSVFPMGRNKENTKLSPTSGGGKKVY